MQARSTGARDFGFRRLAATGAGPLGLATILLSAWPSAALELGLPADCALGRDCFFQQFPDMDPGPGARDPFCGSATYDGHDGTDLRVLSMRDLARGVPVVAMADGEVLRVRDAAADRLVASDADRRAVADRECGNGVILAHEDGYETQYCHMRRGSIAVAPGETVRRGQQLGDVGASGLAQFPHVHVTVRRDGKVLDPATGRSLDEGCVSDPAQAEPLLAPGMMAALADNASALFALGLAGGVIDHDRLVVDGPPPTAAADAAAAVAWAWFGNLRAGDRVRLRLEDPDGAVIAEHLGEALDRAKASYSAYAGKRGSPRPGDYRLRIQLLRAGTVVIDRSETVRVAR